MKTWLACLLIVGAAACARADGPSMEVARAEGDFDPAREGLECAHEVTVTNHSDTPMLSLTWPGGSEPEEGIYAVEADPDVFDDLRVEETQTVCGTLSASGLLPGASTVLRFHTLVLDEAQASATAVQAEGGIAFENRDVVYARAYPSQPFAPEFFDGWTVNHGLDALGQAGELDDPDSDGTCNLLEFYCGTNPTTATFDA